MSDVRYNILQIPSQQTMVDDRKMVTLAWQNFYRLIQQIVAPLGTELSSTINNEQITPDNIQGLSVDSAQVSQAIVDYLIQRLTTGTNPVELIQSGTLHMVYRPGKVLWDIFPVGTPGPDSAGVTFSITDTGQVQYVSTLIDGTPAISKISFRIKTIAAKSSIYSRVGT